MVGKKTAKEPASRVQMMPRDTDGLGKISGGVILSNIDLAAAVVARKACASKLIKKLVTRAMDKVEFKRPVYVNDVLTCYGRITRTGNTSVTVQVDVEAERNGKRLLVTKAEAVFVALNSEGKPTPLSDSIPGSHTGSPKRKRRRILSDVSPLQLLNKDPLLAVRKVMMPHEINSQGDIFGGMLLTYMDMAGAYAAMRSCENRFIERCVTRQMSSIEFKKAVFVGDILSCFAHVTHTGDTSIHVHVDVEVRRGGETIPVTAANLVFVAVDESGKAISAVCSKKKPARCSRQKQSCSRHK